MHPALLFSIGLAGAALVVTAGSMLLWKRPNAAERERRRLERLHRIGRLTDGFIEDVQEGTITYSYSVAGVGYVATQDLSAFPECQEEERFALLSGNVSIKYERMNPSNSMVHCQQWSGFRVAKHSGKRVTNQSGG